ncbi:MAG: hypothetical protein Q4E32_09475 [Bacteroidales bacterium]|nr:hypothetical protein [Bacteroidales bacterium]
MIFPPQSTDIPSTAHASTVRSRHKDELRCISNLNVLPLVGTTRGASRLPVPCPTWTSRGPSLQAIIKTYSVESWRE